MVCFKAKLVVKGCSQMKDIDFSKTFALVAKFNTMRVILALATIMGFEIHQMDIKTAFLNGKLDMLIYMEQHVGVRAKRPRAFRMQVEENGLRVEAIGTSMIRMRSSVLLEQSLYGELCRSLIVHFANLPLHCDCDHICGRPCHFGERRRLDERVEG